jgi:hypothetical protein
VEAVLVRSEFPGDLVQLETQRRRWASGNIGFARRQAVGLLWEGLRRQSRTLAEAGWTLLLLSRPLAFFSLLLSVMLTGASVGVSPGSWARALFGSSLALLAMLCAYFALGVFRLGLTLHRVRLLLSAPVVLARLTAISIVCLLGPQSRGWTRTPR